MGLLEEEAGPY